MSILIRGHSATEEARNRTFGPLYSRNAKAVIERGLMATRSTNWLVMLSGFFEPVLFLISMGVGWVPLWARCRGRTARRSATRRTLPRRCWPSPP